MPLLCDLGANQCGLGPGPRLHSQRGLSANERNVGMEERHLGLPSQEAAGFSQTEVSVQQPPSLGTAGRWGEMRARGGRILGGKWAQRVDHAQHLPPPSPSPSGTKWARSPLPWLPSPLTPLGEGSQSPKSREWRTRRRVFLSHASQSGPGKNLKVKC